MRIQHLLPSSLFIAGLLTAGCEQDDDIAEDLGPGGEVGDGGDGGDGDGDASGDLPFAELYAQGIDRYLGAFSPESSETIGGGAVSHRFSGTGGPLCFTGNEFGMLTRDGDGDALMIFLQGGGLCGPGVCDAVEEAPELIPSFGILSATDPTNPARELDLGYLPYCDGSMWSGDRDEDLDEDGVPDHRFRGLQNLSASLDVVARTYPNPSKILLAGNSAGGFGTHFALPLVRKLYPDVPIALINDSGVGIMSPGTQQAFNDHWNSHAFFPASCDECGGEDGRLTGYHRYQLEQDPNLRMGFISSTQDEMITQGLGDLDAEFFESSLLASVAELESAQPDRFRSMIATGDEHTFIIKDFDHLVGGTTVRAWVAALLESDEAWVSVAD